MGGTDAGTLLEQLKRRKNFKIHLWGNTVAFDANPAFSARFSEEEDVNICFAASGDIRSVVRTVARLPEAGSSGKVVCYINDFNPVIAARNFAFLHSLLSEGESAIDGVIQMWYSSAITQAQHLHIVNITQAKGSKIGKTEKVTLLDILESGSPAVSFDLNDNLPTASLVADFPEEVWTWLAKAISLQVPLQECMRSKQEVTHSVDAIDKTDRILMPLEPYHRVAVDDFCIDNMLLPIGALNAHHNQPSGLLFYAEVGWILGAGSNPLHGWPLPDVLEAGVKHQVPKNDLYGALFFYLRDELGAFLRRVRTHKIEFRLTCMEEAKLALELKNQGVKLDFVDTSNIADTDYVGIAPLLQRWGPLLNKAANPESTLLTGFMNWFMEVPGAKNEYGIPQSEVDRHQRKLTIENKDKFFQLAKGDPLTMAVLLLDMGIKSSIDYCPIFDRFLRDKGAYLVAREVGLQQRKVNKITPFRDGVKLGAPWGTLPLVGMSEKEQYCWKNLSGTAFSEMFVEWVGAGEKTAAA